MYVNIYYLKNKYTKNILITDTQVSYYLYNPQKLFKWVYLCSCIHGSVQVLSIYPQQALQNDNPTKIMILFCLLNLRILSHSNPRAIMPSIDTERRWDVVFLTNSVRVLNGILCADILFKYFLHYGLI